MTLPFTPSRQMLIAACTMLTFFFAVPCAEARFGETFEQCVQRYGQPLKKIDGRGAVFGIATFGKDGVMVTAVFSKTTRKCVLALYTRGDYMAEVTRQKMAPFADAEVLSLYDTVNGRWEPLGPTAAAPSKSDLASFKGPAKVGRSRPGATLGAGKSAGDIAAENTRKRGDESAAALRKFLSAASAEDFRYEKEKLVYRTMSFQDHAISPPFGFTTSPIQHIGRNIYAIGVGGYPWNNPDKSFVSYGVAIMDSDAGDALSAWASAQLEAMGKTVLRKKEATGLVGF